MYCPYGNILNFSRTSRIHLSAFRPFKPVGLSARAHTHTKVKTQYPPVSLRSLGGYKNVAKILRSLQKLVQTCGGVLVAASHVACRMTA